MTKTEGPRHRERERDLFWGLKGFCSYLLVIWEIRNKQTNQKNRGKQRDWLTFGWLSRHGKLNFSLLTDVRAGSSNWMHLYLIQEKKNPKKLSKCNIHFRTHQNSTAHGISKWHPDIHIHSIKTIVWLNNEGEAVPNIENGFSSIWN